MSDIPRTFNFIVCESLREETKGSATFVGVMGSRVMLTPDDAEFASLTIVFTFRDGQGSFPFLFTLADPNGRQLARSEDTLEKPGPMDDTNLVYLFTPFKMTVPGDYIATVTLGGKDFVGNFRIDLESPTASTN